MGGTTLLDCFGNRPIAWAGIEVDRLGYFKIGVLSPIHLGSRHKSGAFSLVCDASPQMQRPHGPTRVGFALQNASLSQRAYASLNIVEVWPTQCAPCWDSAQARFWALRSTLDIGWLDWWLNAIDLSKYGDPDRLKVALEERLKIDDVLARLRMIEQQINSPPSGELQDDQEDWTRVCSQERKYYYDGKRRVMKQSGLKAANWPGSGHFKQLPTETRHELSACIRLLEERTRTENAKESRP
jgi:hypothetical protein